MCVQLCQHDFTNAIVHFWATIRTGLSYFSFYILRSPWSYLEGKEYNLEMSFYCRTYNSFKEKNIFWSSFQQGIHVLYKVVVACGQDNGRFSTY